jgi:hypothetical protein
MRISEFLLYGALIVVIVLAINQLQKPTDASVVYVPSRWWGGYDNWGWGRRIGYNGRGYGHGDDSYYYYDDEGDVDDDDDDADV